MPTKIMERLLMRDSNGYWNVLRPIGYGIIFACLCGGDVVASFGKTKAKCRSCGKFATIEYSNRPSQ